MAGKRLRLVNEEKKTQENEDPPHVRLRQMREFGRLLLADDHIMGLVMDRKVSADSDTERLGHKIVKDIEKLKTIASANGFASLAGIRKIGEALGRCDPIDADLPCAQLMLIASDFELHGHEAVVESARILLNNTEVASSALFALGFEYGEIETISRMGKEEVDRELERMLRKKEIIG